MSTIYVSPSEGIAGIQAAVVALPNGGDIQLDNGDYVGESDNNGTVLDYGDADRIHINGNGSRLLIEYSVSPGTAAIRATGAMGQPTTNILFNDIVSGDTAITKNVASGASSFVPGMHLEIESTNAITGDKDFEYNVVKTTGNDSTGVVGLRFPLTRTGSTVKVFGWVGGLDNRMSNLTVVNNSSALITNLLSMENQVRFLFDDVHIDGQNSLGNTMHNGLIFSQCMDTKFRDGSVVDCEKTGMTIFNSQALKIIHSKLRNCVKEYASTDAMIMLRTENIDTLISECEFQNCASFGVASINVGGLSRRTTIEKSFFAACAEAAIHSDLATDLHALYNTIQGGGLGINLQGNTQSRFKLIGNNLSLCGSLGINLNGAGVVRGIVGLNTLNKIRSVAIKLQNGASFNEVFHNIESGSVGNGLVVGNDCNDNRFVYNQFPSGVAQGNGSNTFVGV